MSVLSAADELRLAASRPAVWSKPVIEELDPLIIELGVRVVRQFPEFYGDMRLGREDRRASKALLNQPSVERLHSLFRYDAETGKLFWRVSPARRVKIGDEAGSVYKNDRTFYRKIEIDGTKYDTHVVAWAMAYGDHDGLNNRFENLRQATTRKTT